MELQIGEKMYKHYKTYNLSLSTSIKVYFCFYYNL